MLPLVTRRHTDILHELITAPLSPASRADLLAALATKANDEATDEDENGVRCDPDDLAPTIAWLLPALTPNLNQRATTREELWTELKASLQMLDEAPDIDLSQLEAELQDPQYWEDACIDRVSDDLSNLVGTRIHWLPAPPVPRPPPTPPSVRHRAQAAATGILVTVLLPVTLRAAIGRRPDPHPTVIARQPPTGHRAPTTGVIRQASTAARVNLTWPIYERCHRLTPPRPARAQVQKPVYVPTNFRPCARPHPACGPTPTTGQHAAPAEPRA